MTRLERRLNRAVPAFEKDPRNARFPPKLQAETPFFAAASPESAAALPQAADLE
jgi:hypothetical protein